MKSILSACCMISAIMIFIGCPFQSPIKPKVIEPTLITYANKPFSDLQNSEDWRIKINSYEANRTWQEYFVERSNLLNSGIAGQEAWYIVVENDTVKSIHLRYY